MQSVPPDFDVLPLFAELDDMLIELLKSLAPEEWNKPTIAKLWTVKDIASHLLDGNLRTLSYSRDGYAGEAPDNVRNHEDLVAYINALNANWTLATKRLSPQVIIDLLQITGKQFIDHLYTLGANDDAVFSVAWAGENVSKNCFHIAREYTEKFMHQQQIRDAVGKQALFTKRLYYPFINTLMQALPHTFRNTPAHTGAIVCVHVLTDIGGNWSILKTSESWQMTKAKQEKPAATLHIDPDTAWKLFIRSMKPGEALNKVILEGDERLAKQALEMVSAMA